MNRRFKENIDHTMGSLTKSTLSGLSTQQLKNITVVIRRSYLHDSDGPTTIQTTLEDPSSLMIHRKGEGEQPLFSRKGIVVNVEEHLEERIVSASPDLKVEERNSKSRHSRSRERSKSRRRSSSSSSDSPRSSPKRRQPKTTGSKDDYLDKRYPDVSRKKVDSDYQKNGSSHKDYDRRSRDKSPKLGGLKSNHPPVKDGYRNDSRRDYRDSPPRRFKSRSRSRSPARRSGYNRTVVQDKDKYVKRHSRSPCSRRRSRSPYPKKRTPSPYSVKRRSHSPYSRRTPKRDVSRSARRSRSPYDDKKRYGSSNSYRLSYYKKRSPSPYARRRSRSPYKSRRRSVTPPHRDGYSSKRDRSKSPHSRRVNSSVEKSFSDLTGYKGIPPEFGFYGPEAAYWLSGPIPRPGFIPRAMVPPPRGMFRPPYFMPRPYLPFPPQMHPNYRPRFNNDSNKLIRLKVSSTSTSTESTVAEIAPAEGKKLIRLNVSSTTTSTGSSVAESAPVNGAQPTATIVSINDAIEVNTSQASNT